MAVVMLFEDSKSNEKTILKIEEGEAHDKYGEIYDRLPEILPGEKQTVSYNVGEKFITNVWNTFRKVDCSACKGILLVTDGNSLIPYGTPMFLGMVMGIANVLKIKFDE